GGRDAPGVLRPPASSSTLICVHTPVLPLSFHDPFSHVSLPNSPGRGTRLNDHSSLPVRASKARATPLVLLCVATVIPSLNDEPTRMTSLVMVGVECSPASPLSRSICLSASVIMPTFRSTTPSLPKVGIGAPVFAFSAMSRYPVVT